MSTTTEAINTHDQLCLAGGGVAITSSYGGARTLYFNGWAIYRIANGKQVVTDPNAHWQDHGKRVFHTFAESGTPAERKRAALDAAKKWVAEQGWYDGKWARNRMHDYVPVHVNKQFPLRKN
jgi:hypothetical protein